MNLVTSSLIKKNNTLELNTIGIICDCLNELKKMPHKKIKKAFVLQEAFNWKLAMRIFLEENKIDGSELINNLLFTGLNFKDSEKEKIKNSMGPKMYSAHLNYFYGIVVEHAIIEVMRINLVKKLGFFRKENDMTLNEKIFINLYGKEISELWKEFCFTHRVGSRNYYVPKKIYCKDHDNFTYWLSKKRILLCTPELNASLISRSLKYLERSGIKDELY